MKTNRRNQQEEKFSIDNLFEKSWHFRNSNEFIKFVKFVSELSTHYSRFNASLVYLQNREVAFFGGASYWMKNFNRFIAEEARPYIILAPQKPVMLVYDIMDTEGEVTPEEFLKKGLGRKPFNIKGAIKQEDFSYVMDEVKSWGINVKFKPLSYFKSGRVTTKRDGNLEIVLKEDTSNELNFATLIHELAHILLGHMGHSYLKNESQNNRIGLQTRILSDSASELEAETASYLVCMRLGLEKNSVEYLAHYIKNEKEDLKQFEYKLVVQTADKIDKIFIGKKVKISFLKSPDDQV